MKSGKSSSSRQAATDTGKKDSGGAKEQSGKSADNAKPSSTRSANQGEKKTTPGK
ncbi:MAG: hypothetical protein ABIN37_16595 [Burkholderiaceae bacterium]